MVAAAIFAAGRIMVLIVVLSASNSPKPSFALTFLESWP
jgi:hypothetical protein